jgi:hypothetical protein
MIYWPIPSPSPQVADGALVGVFVGGTDVAGAVVGGADAAGAVVGGTEMDRAFVGGTDVVGAFVGGTDMARAIMGGTDVDGAFVGGTDVVGAFVGGTLVGALTKGLIVVEQTRNNNKDAMSLAKYVFDLGPSLSMSHLR